MHGIGEPSSNSELGCEEDPDVLGPSSFPSSFPSFLNGTPCERNLSAGDGHPQIGEAALSGPSRLNQDLYICVCVCCALCVVCMYYRDIHYLPSCTRLASLQISVYFHGQNPRRVPLLPRNQRVAAPTKGTFHYAVRGHIPVRARIWAPSPRPIFTRRRPPAGAPRGRPCSRPP